MKTDEIREIIRSFRRSPKATIPLIGVVCLITLCYLWLSGFLGEKGKQAAAVSRQPESVHRNEYSDARQGIRAEAGRVADAIVITGWEDGGDFLGYLTQIAGFYERHRAEFATECKSYQRQLQEWQDFFASKRNSGVRIDSRDYADLKGLVSAARDQLRQIAGHD